MLASIAELSNGAHAVQFYSHDSVLVDVVSRLVGTAIVTGNAAVMLATKAHREAVQSRLRTNGLDVTVARKQGRFIALDCSATLRRVLRGGAIASDEFRRSITRLLARARAKAAGRQVVVFGELVAELVARGNVRAAIQLEKIWNEIGNTERFTLCCGYPMNAFRGEAQAAPFMKICGQHTHVFAAERRWRARSAGDGAEPAYDERRAERTASEVAARYHLFGERQQR